MTHKYRYKFELWREYLVFCYKIHSKKLLFKALTQALSHNPANLSFWLIGVYYEFEIMRNPFKARKLFFKALRINGSKFDYWLEYFAFEVKFLEILTKRAQIIKEKCLGKENTLDFIGFEANLAKETDLEGKGWDQSKEIEVLKTIYETCKEKFELKNVALGFLKKINEFEGESMELLNEIIMKDIEELVSSDGIFALEVFRIRKNGKIEEFLEMFEKHKENVDFLIACLKKPLINENLIHEILIRLKNHEYIEEIAKNKCFITALKNVIEAVKEINAEFPIELLGFLEKNIEDYLEIYMEIVIYVEKQKKELKMHENEKNHKNMKKEVFLLNMLKSKGFTKKHVLLQGLLAYIEALGLYKEKTLLLDDIFNIALENLLLNPKDFNVFLKRFFMFFENFDEKVKFYKKLLILKRACPLEIYLDYIKENANMNYNEGEILFKQIDAWFPKNLLLKEAHLAYVEGHGDYVRSQGISKEIADMCSKKV